MADCCDCGVEVEAAVPEAEEVVVVAAAAVPFPKLQIIKH